MSLKIVPDMKNIVGARIREARLQAQTPLSQQELAARLQAKGVEIDQTAISRIEGGDRQVTDVELLAVCQALGITVESLFVGLRLPQDR